jgi:hypothetical protein
MVNGMTTRRGGRIGAFVGVFLGASLASAGAAAATYEVGPGKPHASLKSVTSLLQPGDIVEVQGNATYAGDVKLTKAGTASKKITIRGIRVNGKRPVLSGGTNTLEIAGNHHVIEGFEVTGGSSRCVFHRSHDVTIRDTSVHDCPSHGILGAMDGSGSLTLEYVEVYKAGAGGTRHPIYMDTDEHAYPGAVFRMQHCYVHQGLGGNAVKSRAERNEIYYNWIEGAYYRELELVAPDGEPEGLAREDGDIVGNVFRKTTGTFYTVRVGSDATGGSTHGRYRFVNNTFLLAQNAKPVVEIFWGIETIEMHNNAFFRAGGGPVTILQHTDVKWAAGKPLISGRNNWAPTGSTVPSQWQGTITGNNPGFVSLTSFDLRPAEGSPLRDAGLAAPPSIEGHAFPSPLVTPLFVPPAKTIVSDVKTLARAAVGPIDIGAYEGAGPVAPPKDDEPQGEEPADPPAEPAAPAEPGAVPGPIDEGSPVEDDAEPPPAAAEDVASEAGSCGIGGARAGGAPWLALVALGLSIARRRRRAARGGSVSAS